MAYPSQSRRPSTGQSQFSHIAKAEIQRSKFNRSHGLKTTFSSGLLIPVFVDEALPGDTMSLRMNTFARLATPIHPFMDNMWLDSFFFAVPIRLLWENWQKFNGEQANPGDSIDFEIPQIAQTTSIANQSLSDYFGLPNEATNITYSALWHRAYALIWNEFFRDENLQDSILVNKDDGPDDKDAVVLQRRGKRKDYFTSCLPFPQKGPSVSLLFEGIIPVQPEGGTDGVPRFGTTEHPDGPLSSISVGGVIHDGVGYVSSDDLKWVDPKLEADLSQATSNTINQIRLAFQIQRLYERDARGGTRYTEIIRSHFGVVSPDARLQRPEYLGGGSQNIAISPVPQTGVDFNQEGLGTLGAYGISTGSNHTFNKSFTEHCVLIGMVSVRADLNYQEGMNRMWSRKTRWDFYWPALSHIGEQAVLNQEIHARGDLDPLNDALVFGYQSRWDEYRYKPSQITGRLRSSAPGSLDTWHLAQDFGATTPTLNATFIEDTPPIDRVSAVAGQPEFIFDAYFQYNCARPMPTYSTPGLIDHF